MIDSNKSFNNEELVALLSRYFTERGQFLAQVIRADMQSMSHTPSNTNGYSKSNGNGNGNGNGYSNGNGNGYYNGYNNGNGHNTQNAVRQNVVQPLPVMQSVATPQPAKPIQLTSNTNGYSNGNRYSNGNGNGYDNGYSNGNSHNTQNVVRQNVGQPLPVMQSVAAPEPAAPIQPVQAIQPVQTIQPVTSTSKDVAAILVDLVVEQTGYPKESIGLELKLLDDLNLDSIKAGEVVAAAAKKCGVAGQLDPSTLANASLQEVIAVINSAIPAATPVQPAVSANTAAPQPPENNDWVRNFAVEYVAQGK